MSPAGNTDLAGQDIDVDEALKVARAKFIAISGAE